MSIIIVGIGNEDFEALSAMIILDGDHKRVSFKGQVAERDIVQFVAFRDFLDLSRDNVINSQLLAKEVLAEIPEQFIGYMKSKHIFPNITRKLSDLKLKITQV
ncbi:copine-8 isoform X1 [Lingula anatina]|uniref:Copine-8 isoform X1 n=1 Tax=Lingula anatina TaxID=7574 RepID=A0A1S3ID50_LINAN|nr:copine-8 isoform X1 [Lingula anatina]|eukprot:XP_013396190.1 copine-8 isoform X1 [Lingula anatina]